MEYANFEAIIFIECWSLGDIIDNQMVIISYKGSVQVPLN